MKKTSTRFSEKTAETGKGQKTLAEKIGPVGKKEEKVLTEKSDSYDKSRQQVTREKND